MKKSKIIYIIIFAIIVASCVWAFLASSIITYKFKKDIFNNELDNQRVNIKNLIIVETKDNTKHWEMFAETGYYDSFSENAILNDIIGNFYDNSEVVVSFKAKQATFNDSTKRINLNQDAVIVYKDGTYIEADDFVWEGQNDSITATGNIKIVKPNEAVITGDNAKMSNKMTNFKITGKTVTKLYGEKGEKVK